MLAIAVIASAGSAYGTGPFAFDLLTPEMGNLAVFELSMVVVFLSLSLAVGQERTTARRLNQSEELFRRIFETSVAGMLIADRDTTGWKVLRANDSAVVIVPGHALLPGTLVPTRGWTSGAALVPAEQVGGHFYAIRVQVPQVVLSHGDQSRAARHLLARCSAKVIKCRRPRSTRW